MARQYNGGSWTEGRFKTFVISALRSASRRWPPKYRVLDSAFVGHLMNPKTKRIGKHYKCAACTNIFPAKMVQVDHVCAVSADDGFTSWDSFIENLFCEEVNLQVLCLECHKIKSYEEKHVRKSFTTQNMRATYQCWSDMKRRCFNVNSQRFYTHGAKGITVCNEWKNSFDRFLQDMGEKPEGLTLDRIDNNGNYEPTNCRWATPKEQANNRSTCIYIEYNGEKKTVQQWAESLNLTFSSLMKRLRNWPLEAALSSEKTNVETVPEEIKKEILELWRTTSLSQQEVANMYDISQSAISLWHRQEQNASKQRTTG